MLTDVDTTATLCRVQTGELQTGWLNWLPHRAGRTRTWWAASMDEQVLLLAVGGELDTAFVLPRIFSDDYPAPSVSADAFHVIFPDDAVIEYEPETSALADSSIKIANITASQTLITSCQRYGLEHQPALLSTRPK